jgi:ATP-dependent DNA helicase DinG
MAKLSDLLSENTDRQKVFSTLKRISRGKGPASNSAVSNDPALLKPSLFDPERLEFVAIDVETTGLDSKTDRIIEIGAIKFDGVTATSEYTTFVNPETTLPEPIVRLTGITQADLSTAPAFRDIAERLLEFIGRLPLCGHQIDFDISFLNEELKRLGKPKLASSEIDTALLSRIVVPDIDRFSLKHVARSLGISLETAHRALFDAKASGQVACSLLSRLDTIPVHVRSAMARFAPGSFIKTLLFKSIGSVRESGEPSLCLGAVERPPKRLSQNDSLSEVSLDTIKSIFEGGGGLAGQIAGFSVRQSQTRMARCVAEAFNTNSFLVAEAGTGTGKSLAYLVPAALHALKNNVRVLVSTHTRNLQDQLVSKDLPVVKKIAGDQLRFSVLKGRMNYLCIRRYFLLLSGNLLDLSPRERMGVLPLIRWAAETKTGDIEEQNQFNIKWFSRIWRMICADAHLCEGKKCPEYGRCFLQNARLRALGSHIVVINHALFYSEICSESSFLGPLGPCIFDEAHHLESSGHRYLRVEVDTNRFMQFIDGVTAIDKEVKTSGALDAANNFAESMKPVMKRLRSEIRSFLAEIDFWVKSQHPASLEFQLGYDGNAFAHLGSYAALVNGLSELQDVLNNCLQSFEYETRPEIKDNVLPQVRLTIDKTSQLKSDLMYVAAAVTEDHVFWAEGNRKKGWVKLCGVTLDIGSILSHLWEQNERACVFTSATLSVARSLDYFKQKIGLAGANESKTRCELFESPFHHSQTIRCSLPSVPDPDAPEYPAFVAGLLASLFSEFRKNVLVLFTANSMLEAVYSCCKNLPFSSQCTILGQGISGTRQAILDEFKNSRPCILLGADSFWEGIDMPGASCEIVVITRLPFQMPTHPLTKALAQRMQKLAGESFFSFSVPEAVIKFRQGSGRLIRDRSDRGALLVLDNRIITKNYGKRFCESLDGEMKSFATADELMIGLRSFFAGESAQQPDSIYYVPLEEA